MTETTIHRNNREYVTVTEFARRLDVTRASIYRCIKKGLLFPSDIKGSGSTWLDWETQKAQFATIKKFPQKTHADLKKKTVNLKNLSTPKAPGIDAMEGNDFEKEPRRPSEEIDINTINPFDYPDCWFFDDIGPIINHETGKPKLDYDKLKAYLTSLKYQLDIKKQRGELIEKHDVSFAIQDAMRILSTELSSIPRKFAEPMLAFVELQTHQKLSMNDRKMLTSMLQSKPKEILDSIEKAFQDYMDRGDL